MRAGPNRTRFPASLLFPLLGLMLYPAAQAASFHVCDCASGAQPACQAGSDEQPGTADLPWQSYERARQAFAQLSPGDELRFCRGGAWTIDGAGERWINSACTAEQACRVGAYQPPQLSEPAPRPFLLRNDGGHGFSLADGGTAEQEEGYVFESLVIHSTTPTGYGFFIQNDVDDVLIRDVEIVGFRIGVYLAGANDCSPVPGCDGRNERIVLEQATVLDNQAFGWLGSSNGSEIRDSHFENNGSLAVFDHNIYLSDTSDGLVTGMRVLRNRLHRSALDEEGVCRAVSLVVHGRHSDLLIEGNEVWELPGAAAGGCWGISVDPGYAGEAEAFSDVVIRGNTVRNVGNQAIGIAACNHCLIENNVIVQEQALSSFSSIGIAAPNRARMANDQVMDQVTIRNNSIWFGPEAGGTGIRLGGEGGAHELVSNAIRNDGGPGFDCFELDLPAERYQAVDHNHCHASQGAFEWADGQGSLAQWQSSSGFDLHSSTEAPGFLDPPGFRLEASGADAPMVGAGHPTASSPRDILGLPRGPAPDAGAYQWRAGSLFQDRFETPTSP